MGDPRKLRKKYSTPNHPWQKERIESEAVLMKEYGFKNKIELWKLNSILKKFKFQIKNLIPKKDATSENQKKNLLMKIYQYGLVKENAIPEDILGLTLKDMCERRFSTLVFKKGLAKSVMQARQFITHEHVMIGDKKITSPSYLVTSNEELMMKIGDNSPMVSEDHPERVPLLKKIEEEMKEAGLKPETIEPVVEDKPKKKARKSAKQELKEDVKREEAEEAKEEETQ
jgi:small subunit ribosomal protein S4